MKVKDSLVIMLFVETIVLCLIASFRFISIESTVTLLIFNGLFFSLTFQLNGTLTRKVCILTLGNIVGLFWNIVFFYFSWVGLRYLGIAFNAFYIIIFPIFNLMWIIPYWSFSLSFLSQPKNADLKVKL